jgi:hypothetical protein
MVKEIRMMHVIELMVTGILIGALVGTIGSFIAHLMRK